MSYSPRCTACSSPLTEDSETLHNLLQLVYWHDEEPSKLGICVKVAVAAQKYAMDKVTLKLRKIIIACEVMEKEPLKVFAIGVHLGWADIIKEASLNTLSIPVRDLLCTQCKDLQATMALDLNDLSDLISWRYACHDAPERYFCITNSKVRNTVRDCMKERLAETGCPHSTVLMDDSFVIKAMQKLDSVYYDDVMPTCRTMRKEVNQEILKVPFKVKDIWIIPQT